MYNAQQQSLFATELARAGGNVTLAAAALRREYETMRGISERTLYRFLERKDVATQIAAETVRLRAIWEAEATRVERLRAAEEYRGSDRAPMRDVSGLIVSIHEHIKAWAESETIDEKLRPGFLLLYERLLKIHDARLIKILPCISDNGELYTVLQTLGLELKDELGPRAPDFMATLQKRVAEALRVRQKQLQAAPASEAAHVDQK